MIDKKTESTGCSCGGGCCGDAGSNPENKRKITIDFLYLDLSVCTRCQGADNSLEDALTEVSGVLHSAGIDVEIRKINVISEELAILHKFISSPTIRLNGRDIQIDVKESRCNSCGDLCGDSVDCRVWIYQGKEYNVPPKAMIVEAILKSVYGNDEVSQSDQEYAVPQNLRRFYAAMIEKQNAANS